MIFDSDRTELADGLNVLAARMPTARTLHLQTSDQDTYGFVFSDIEFDDGTMLSESAAQESLDAVSDLLRDYLMNLRWDSIVGEDKGGAGQVAIPLWTVTTLPFGDTLLTITEFGPAAEGEGDPKDRAQKFYDDMADGGARVRLYQGAAGTQTPLKDSVRLTVLDEEEGVESVFDSLLRAIVAQGHDAQEPSVNVGRVGVRNAIRAYRMRGLLESYAEYAGMNSEPTETVLRDVLNDMHHLAMLLGKDLGDYVARAETSFLEEVAGEP